jgi:hypothetical protein
MYLIFIVFLYLKNPKSVTSDTPTTKTPSDWAVFIPNDDVLQTYTLPQAKQRGFNKNTISKPVRNCLHFDETKKVIYFFL